MANPKFTNEEAIILRQLYEAGETTVSLAARHNVSADCVTKWIRKAGGVIRSNSDSKRIFCLDEMFFDNIDSEIKAYWLGFLMADGYIGKYNGRWRNLWCTLSSKDADHLKLFLNNLQSNYPVRSSVRDGYSKAFICLTSLPMVNGLVDKGWLRFKRTGDCEILDYVPLALWQHFIRGYFDGDGSLVRKLRQDRKAKRYSYSWVLVAHLNHHDFLDRIRVYLCDQIGLSDKLLKRRSSTWNCHWNGNRQVERLCAWMYDGATVWLDRKKRRFDELRGGVVDFVWPRTNDFTFLLKPTQIAMLPEDQRQQIIDRFCYLAMHSQWVAPRSSDDALLADYRAITLFNNQSYNVYHNDKLVGFRSHAGGGSQAPGKRIILHYQPHFWSVKTGAAPITARWNNEKIIRRAAIQLLTTGTKISLDRYIRELRYAGVGVTSHFHPNFAMAIIQSLAPDIKTWFDPSMGWGGRLLAAHILGIQYEGCDPQSNTFRGLEQINLFVQSSAVLHCLKAQCYQFTKQFDLGFSSPPFFNKERYGGPEQSYEEFITYDKWATGFLGPLVDALLNNCDRVILHVDERMKDTLCKWYKVDIYPVSLQRNPGGPLGYEFVLDFIRGL